MRNAFTGRRLRRRHMPGSRSAILRHNIHVACVAFMCSLNYIVRVTSPSVLDRLLEAIECTIDMRMALIQLILDCQRTGTRMRTAAMALEHICMPTDSDDDVVVLDD